MKFNNINEYLDFAKYCRSCNISSKNVQVYAPVILKQKIPINILDDMFIIDTYKVNIFDSVIPTFKNPIYLDANCINCGSFTKSDALGLYNSIYLFSDNVYIKNNIYIRCSNWHGKDNEFRYHINGNYNLFIDKPDFSNKDLLINKIQTLINFS